MELGGTVAAGVDWGSVTGVESLVTGVVVGSGVGAGVDWGLTGVGRGETGVVVVEGDAVAESERVVIVEVEDEKGATVVFVLEDEVDVEEGAEGGGGEVKGGGR